MSGAELAVTLGGVGAIAFLVWFFFGPRQAQAAHVKGSTQEIGVTVKGGYSPDIIRVRKGVPLRLSLQADLRKSSYHLMSGYLLNLLSDLECGLL